MSLAAGRKERPKPFAEDWSLPGTPRPPGTVANPLGATGRVEAASLRPVPIGERFRRYTAEQVAGAPAVDGEGGVDLSPDGGEVAFAWDRSGHLEIYTAPLLGDRIIQLTGAARRSTGPRWSPDGRWIVFVRDGGELWLVDRDGARERRLTPEEAATHSDPDWSPDGARIAYAASKHGRSSALYVMDVATGEHRRLTDGRAEDRAPRWSPDGSSILFWSRREGDEASADLYVVPAQGGDARLLATRDGMPGASMDGRWSPDGSTIAFTTSVRGRSEIAFAHLRDGSVARIERLGATPFDDSDASWRPDGRGVVYLQSKDADVSVRRVFTVSHADDGIADLPGVHRSPRVGSDSETAVAVFSGGGPADIVVRPKGATEIARITRSLPDVIDPAVLVEPTLVGYPGADRAPVASLLYVPHAEAVHGPGAPPAVVRTRPGPKLRREWDPLAQLLANHGYAVLVTDERETDRERLADWLQEGGIADWSRIAVIGEAPTAADRAGRIAAAEHALQDAREQVKRA